MIRVRRKAPAPPVLEEAEGRGKKEIARAAKAFADHEEKIARGENAKRFSFEFKAYKAGEVKARLEAIFHGKCAYCESRYVSTQPMDVEHFRPKGAVAEDADHPGYYWLAAEWSNLLPSCIDCNRKRGQFDEAVKDALKLGKQSHFPIEGIRASAPGQPLEAEKALLIDPCRETPSNLLKFDVRLGLVHPRASRGRARKQAEESIKIYGLNRGGLVTDRKHILRLIDHRLELVSRLVEIRDRLVDLPEPGDIAPLLDEVISMVTKEIFEMRSPERPYAALAREAIRELGAGLDQT